MTTFCTTKAPIGVSNFSPKGQGKGVLYLVHTEQTEQTFRDRQLVRNSYLSPRWNQILINGFWYICSWWANTLWLRSFHNSSCAPWTVFERQLSPHRRLTATRVAEYDTMEKRFCYVEIVEHASKRSSGNTARQKELPVETPQCELRNGERGGPALQKSVWLCGNCDWLLLCC